MDIKLATLNLCLGLKNKSRPEDLEPRFVKREKNPVLLKNQKEGPFLLGIDHLSTFLLI